MPWLILVVAGLFEIGWPVGFKFAYQGGQWRWQPATGAVFSMIASFVLLVWAQQSINIGTAYAVWTGIGTVGTAIAGIAIFHEPATAARLFCMSLILAGIVGLKVTEPMRSTGF